MKRHSLSSDRSNRRFKVVRTAVNDESDFDQRWDEKFGPEDDYGTFTAEEYKQRLKEMLDFEA